MKNILLLLTLLLMTKPAFAQKITESEISVSDLLKGTLYSPEKSSAATKLFIMISGSGPTNRSGNQIGMQTNCSKYLAQELAKSGTAVFTYDKRMFAQIANGTIDEKSGRFDDNIVDAKTVIDYFRAQKKYSKIVIAGHSEGSTVGMVAANKNADGFISIAGPGRPADQLILEQLAKQSPEMAEKSKVYFEKLQKGETFKNEIPILESLFRESVQPYLISWIKYNPQTEISKLSIPVLILNGTKDIQVSVAEADLLKKAKPDAQLAIITNMNHVLKEIKGDNTENMAAYNNPNLPVMPELITVVNQFLKSI